MVPSRAAATAVSAVINESAPRGGKTIYGATLGILMLETEFPRVHGDVGNAATFPFPVLYKVVPGATSYSVVEQKGAGLDNAFIDAARELVQIGADGIGTSCGFLSLFQQRLTAAAGVPVATSSLMQVPWVQRTLPPGKRVGVVTISSGNLTPAHFEAVGAPVDTPVIGTEGGTEFTRSITGGSHTLDVEASRDDIVAVGRELMNRHPEIGALVLECTNMGPYPLDLHLALGVPVFDIISLLTWFQAGLRPRRFQP
jgi:hypothetical protein